MKKLIKSSIAVAVLAASWAAQAAPISFTDDFSIASAKVENNVVGSGMKLGTLTDLGGGFSRQVGASLISATNISGVSAPVGAVINNRSASAVAGPAWAGSPGSMDGSSDQFLKAVWELSYTSANFTNTIGDFSLNYFSDLTAPPITFELYSGGAMIGTAQTVAAVTGTVTFEVKTPLASNDFSLYIRPTNAGGDVSISGVSYTGTNPTAVPAPTTLALSGLGLVALGLGRRRLSK